MGFAVFGSLILGVVIGGAIAWYLLQQRLADLDRQHKQQLDRLRQGLEQDFEIQKQTARKNFDRELQALQAQLDQLKARSTAPSPAPSAAAPAPTPAPTPAPAPTTTAAKLPDPWGGVTAAPVAAAPIPTPAPEPIATPEPGPIAAPEPAPAPIPEPEPIAPPEPEPIATPEPAPAPAPIPEPEPIATPEPEPEPAPAPTPEPEPIAIVAPIAEPVASISAAPSPLAQVASLAARVRSLGQRAEARSPIAELCTFASHPDPQLRASAIAALAPISSPEVLELLQKALHDAAPTVVQAAAKALDRYKAHPPIAPSLPEPTLPANGSPQKSS
ncbi:MAG: hypothetical protein EA001_05210 [Oscillatoriales cyanobacterium]|nr:MAG: hypothetical protein EA001_05210 [Oscillatoriales cyanobacterium]